MSSTNALPPLGATHMQLFYDSPMYYRKIMYEMYNNVSDEMQPYPTWLTWNYGTRQWEWVGQGFSSHKLQPLYADPDLEHQQCENIVRGDAMDVMIVKVEPLNDLAEAFNLFDVRTNIFLGVYPTSGDALTHAANFATGTETLTPSTHRIV